MLSGQSRGAAAYVALTNAGKLAGLTNAEQGVVLQQLILVLGADTAYLQQNAQILPNTLEAQPGATVATPTGPGSVTSPSQLSGYGTLS